MSPKKPKPLRECFRRNNKLTIEQVREIKKLLAMGEHPAMIAPQFGVKKPPCVPFSTAARGRTSKTSRRTNEHPRPPHQ